MIRKFKTYTPKLGKRVFVDEQASVIGDVSIGNDSSIWPQTVVRGDINPITIGHRTNIQDGSIVYVTHKSEYSNGYECHIGSDVTVGHGCIIHACVIEDMSLIGMGSVILDGAKIKSNIIKKMELSIEKIQKNSLPLLNEEEISQDEIKKAKESLKKMGYI